MRCVLHCLFLHWVCDLEQALGQSKPPFLIGTAGHVIPALGRSVVL